MSNIYEQGYRDELNDLQDSLIDIQNTLTSMYTIKDEIWRYHPNNKNFINPIKEYNNISSEIDELERKISKIELNILHLKSAN